MHCNNVFQFSKIRTRKRNAKKSIRTVKNWNPALFGIRNPPCWNPESSTRNPESTAWNPESKNVPDSLTWGERGQLMEDWNGPSIEFFRNQNYFNHNVGPIEWYYRSTITAVVTFQIGLHFPFFIVFFMNPNFSSDQFIVLP